MQVIETLSAGLKREYKVVVGAAELGEKLDAKLKELSTRARIRGFRPGKVPVAHLRRIYGRSAMAEVVQETIDAQSKAVLAEKSLKPAYQPEVKLPDDEAAVNAIMDGKGDLAFSMAFEVLPDFELKDHTGLELVRHVVEVTEAHVAETLDRIARQSRSWEDKDGAAEKGDKVTISFVGTIDGVAFEGGTADDVDLEIGSGQFIPGFEEQLIGARAGDDVTVKVTFPDDYSVKDLAGKAAEFATKITRVQSPKVAVIDDDLARKMGFEDLARLTDMVRERTAAEFARMSGMKLKRDVLDALDRMYAFDLPERLVEAEFDGIWNALTAEMARSGRTFEDEKTTEEEARKEYRAIAERRVRLGLVLGTLGEREGIQVSEQELQQALFNRMRQFPGQEKQVIDYYRKNPAAMMELRGPIFEQKVVDAIVAKANVTEKAVTREELQAMVADEGEDQDAAA